MFKLFTNRRLWMAVAVVAGLLAVALWPVTVPVDVAAVGRGPLIVSVDEEGETRVRERFVVSAPVTGRVQRIELEVGDLVAKGALLTHVRPESAPLLDDRTRAELRAATDTARAAEGRARADESRARTTLTQAQRELARGRELLQAGLATRQELDTRATDVQAAEDALRAAEFAVRAATSEVQRIEARLLPSSPGASGRPVPVTAPTAGVVLKRIRESESLVPAGEPLIEIGDPARLEIVSDVLSTDAVRIKPGARVLVEQWGGERTLEARVRRIEPAGFTKVSALGVEEQRVNVVMDFVDPAEAWAALGDAYRVEVRIVLWEAADVLTVPTSALFREGEAWGAYIVRDNRAHRTVVQLGHRTGQSAEVLSGLSAGDVVVLYPGEALADNARVQASQPSQAQPSQP